jgi:hypothetical protein
MNSGRYWRWVGIGFFCAPIVGLPAQSPDEMGRSRVQEFTKDGRGILSEIATLRLAEVAGFGVVSKCAPQPRPEGCPMNCPTTAGLEAFRQFAQGSTHNVAAMVSPDGPRLGDDIICDPRPVESKLNELRQRTEGLGLLVADVGRDSITILRDPPRTTNTPVGPQTPAAQGTNSALDRGIRALIYLSAVFSKQPEPKINVK